MMNPMEAMAACFEQVASFFPSGDPKKQESFARRAEYLDSRVFSRECLADSLKNYHQQLGANRQTLKLIEELRQKETLAVVTGQQAGILTGPLYTLYKAMTAIRLAQEQRKKLGRPVVPVFWIAGEDHDWLEIRSTYILNSSGKPALCRLKGDGGGKSVGNQPAPSWETIKGQLYAALPEGEFRRRVLEQCRQVLAQAENLSQWFALTLQWLLQKWGLIFFDPLLPEFKHLAAPLYGQVLELAGVLPSALAEQTEKWLSLGFQAQIRPTGGEVNLFLSLPERRAIMRKGQMFALRGKEKEWDWAALNSLLAQSPEKFSPNVVTRPVVQEFLLPTLAYIAGPGEVNYWAQLGRVFRVFGFVMPIIYPRLSAVVLTARWQKLLDKQDLVLADVYQGLAGRRERCVREQDDLEIDNRLEYLRAQISKGYAELQLLEEIHVNVHDLLLRNEEKINFQLDYLRRKLWQAQRKRCRKELEGLRQLEDGIMPFRSRQERVLNPLSFVARYGLSFVDLVAELPLQADFSEQQILL